MGVGAARGRGSEEKEIEIYKDRGGVNRDTRKNRESH